MHISQIKKKNSFTTSSVIAALGRANITDRKATMVARSIAQNLGQDILAMTLSISFIRHYRKQVKEATYNESFVVC